MSVQKITKFFTTSTSPKVIQDAATQSALQIFDSSINPLHSSDDEVEEEEARPVNRGTGAGGSKTTKNGKEFEQITSNVPRLLAQGYESIFEKIKTDTGKEKKYNYLRKITDDKKIIYIEQDSFKLFVKDKYGVTVQLKPDEAYIIEHNDSKIEIKILEKKVQTTSGSVDIKLLAGENIRRYYRKSFKKNSLGKNFEIQYGFCVNDYLKKLYLKDTQLREIYRDNFMEDGIDLLFGDDDNYFETLDAWINK